jgi:hypothetical protein
MKIKRGKNHGFSGTKIYNNWRAMKQRCYDISQWNKEYQGKGIIVFDDWHHFVNFKEWAYNNGFKDGLVIDRIDANKNYEPNNCRWVTPSQNTINRNLSYDYSKRKKNRYIKLKNGELIGVKDYAIKNNLVYNTFRAKLKNLGSIINEVDIHRH